MLGVPRRFGETMALRLVSSEGLCNLLTTVGDPVVGCPIVLTTPLALLRTDDMRSLAVWSALLDYVPGLLPADLAEFYRLDGDVSVLLRWITRVSVEAQMTWAR